MNRLLLVFLTVLLGMAAQPVAAEAPQVGDPAPGFELADQNGELHSLEDYRDEWVALYFYPKDDTPGCTTEACEFRDDIFEYRKLGARVIGVSLDDSESHKEFADKYGLPFPLLADTRGTTADAYGVKSRLFGLTLAKRQTFLIDPQGIVVRHYEDVDPDTHSAELLADLEQLTASTVLTSDAVE